MGQNGGTATRSSRCIALVGPFLSGKTTLLEAILARTGAVSRQGRVADANTVGDAGAEARAHGMSTELNVADVTFLGDRFTFIDCPGSIEFQHESALALTACDAAVVVCEPDPKRVPALQLILKQLEDRGIPRFLFLNKLDSLFSDAYREAEHEGASPGYTTNQLHFWNTVLIQDFWYGNWGDGALIWGQTQDARPHYVGGGAWNAYKRAANNYSVWPGYPINTEHDWNRVRIQDFRGGGWGDGAIIGGANAELVAGNHWRAYISADGSNRLRNPVTFVNYQSGEFYADPFGGGYRVSGWFWVQQFEGGQIWERNGTAYVWFYDTGTWHQVL